MDEQNTFDGYFKDLGVQEPNATEIPKAHTSEPKPDVVVNENYQDYTASYQQQIPVNNPYYANYGAPQNSRSNETTGLGVASLVMGILTLLTLCCFFPLAPIFGIIGIILYVIDRKNSSSGVSKAGFICSLIGTILSVLVIIFVVVIVVIAAAMPAY